MNTVLNIIGTNELSEEAQKEIDTQIERIISKHKDNRYEINKLVFESVSVLTASENYSSELASQGVIKRFWRGITGKNRDLQNKIDRSLAASQYASQQTLQKLAEQNLMSFELITAVNNKLNTSIVQIEGEINKIYGTLITFFRQTKSDIVQLENRLERLENNVKLLNWQNSIEYQMWDGTEYSNLDEIEKIVCIIRDFYDITKANWTTSDLLLLKTAMSTIGISPKLEIVYSQFIQKISKNERLLNKLFDGFNIDGIENYPEYIAISSGIKKNLLLTSDEKYLVDSTVEMMKSYSCDVSQNEIEKNLLLLYERDKANIDLELSVSAYDLILEMLYNMEQMKEIQYVKTLDIKLQQAELLFSVYETKKLIPILEELISYGVVKAKYMMALLYETGCAELKRDYEKCDGLLNECIIAGYLPAKVRRLIPLYRNIENHEICKKELLLIIDELENMAKSDKFACEECARVYVNAHLIGLEKNAENYQKTIKYFEQAPLVLGYYGIAMRYQYGQGVEKDLECALEYFKKSAKYDYNQAVWYIGFANENLWTSECSHKGAGRWYERAYELGNYNAITNLAWCYTKDNGEYGMPTDYDRFFQLSMKAYELGDMPAWGIANIGWAYQYGNGVDKDIEMAKKYYKEAADMGDEFSQNKLAELEK